MRSFLVISDVHGDRARLSRALAAARHAHAVFFLGDGLSEVSELLSRQGMPPLYAVRGNCDVGILCEEELVVSLYRDFGI